MGDFRKGLARGLAVGGADPQGHEQPPPEVAKRHRHAAVGADPPRTQPDEVGRPQVAVLSVIDIHSL